MTVDCSPGAGYNINILGVHGMTQRNKMILEIGPNIYCARYYSDIPATEQNTWWFCTADYALYEQQVLFDSLG